MISLLVIVFIVWTFLGIAVFCKLADSDENQKLNARLILLMGPIVLTLVGCLILVSHLYDLLIDWAFNSKKKS